MGEGIIRKKPLALKNGQNWKNFLLLPVLYARGRRPTSETRIINAMDLC